MSNKKTKT